MKGGAEEMLAVPRASGDVPAERACLRCQTRFWSDGFGQRICPPCKGSASWKSAVPMGGGGARRQ